MPLTLAALATIAPTAIRVFCLSTAFLSSVYTFRHRGRKAILGATIGFGVFYLGVFVVLARFTVIEHPATPTEIADAVVQRLDAGKSTAPTPQAVPDPPIWVKDAALIKRPLVVGMPLAANVNYSVTAPSLQIRERWALMSFVPDRNIERRIYEQQAWALFQRESATTNFHTVPKGDALYFTAKSEPLTPLGVRSIRSGAPVYLMGEFQYSGSNSPIEYCMFFVPAQTSAKFFCLEHNGPRLKQ